MSLRDLLRRRRLRREVLANLDLAMSSLPAPDRQRPRSETTPVGSPDRPVRVLVIDEADVAPSP